MSEIAKHEGTVISCQNGIVKVRMNVLSACGSCKAHEKCGFVDKSEKIIEIETNDMTTFKEGDCVEVSVNESLGLTAVLLAYIIPAILIVGGVIILSIKTDSEALAATLPIVLVTIYFLFLYRQRDKLQKKFSFGIEKKTQPSHL